MHSLDTHPVTDLVVTLKGHVSTGHIDALEQMLWKKISAGQGGDVEIDMRAVEFLGAPAVAVLVEAHFRTLQRGNRLRLTGCREHALPMLEACGVLDVRHVADPAPASRPSPTPEPAPPGHSFLRTLSRGVTAASAAATALRRHLGRR